MASRAQTSPLPSEKLSTRPAPNSPKVSIIIPVYNAAPFLQHCLESVLAQRGIPLSTIQLVVYDDASQDGSFRIASDFQPRLHESLHSLFLVRGMEGPLGCGASRNRACALATSALLVFQDADDVMHPDRVVRSVAALQDDALQDDARIDVIGGRFQRIPNGSTPRYEQYHYQLQTNDLFAHAFRDAPLPMPTVACRTSVWHAVPFVEGPRVPEDLHFFYGAMKKGFRLHKLLGNVLTYYRFHESMTSLSIHRRDLLAVRVRAFEDLVLSRPEWRTGFSIWNSGRDGKQVFNLLSSENKEKLQCWGDINPRKIGLSLKGRPIVHFSQLTPPIACCVVLDRQGREFEANLASLRLQPGHHFVHLV